MDLDVGDVSVWVENLLSQIDTEKMSFWGNIFNF